MTYERPTQSDVQAVVKIARANRNLDRNSCYLYALHCLHFRDTSLVAKSSGEVVGFVIGYRIPDKRDIHFIWQYGMLAPYNTDEMVTELVSQIIKLEDSKGLSGVDVSLDLSHHSALRLFTVIAMKFNLITHIEHFDKSEVMIHLESRKERLTV